MKTCTDYHSFFFSNYSLKISSLELLHTKLFVVYNITYLL